jgi:hypothetical protein
MYQYDNGKLGKHIGWQEPTFLADPQNRLIYVPPRYAQSWPFNPIVPYAVIGWSSSDLCTKSALCTSKILILPVPTPPISPNFNVTIFEDKPTAFNMDVKAWDPDLKMDGKNETTTWQLLSNPSDIFRTRVVSPDGDVSYPVIPTGGDTFYHFDDGVWLLGPPDATGVFTGSYRAKDETGSIGQPGVFNIHILPVNDPPTISITAPYIVTMGSWNTISLKAFDKDSKEWYIQVNIEDDMKGTLKEGKKIDSNGKAIGNIVSKGDISFFFSKIYG